MNDEYLESKFGKIVSEAQTPAADESLWPIEQMSEALVDIVSDVYLDFPKDLRIDVGGGTSVITVKTMNDYGKEEFTKLMGKRWKKKTKDNVEVFWAQIKRVVSEESSLYV
jgi:hypothetical protein